jgi:hypothetical protein
MRQSCDVLVIKGRYAMFIHSTKMRLPGLLVSLLGVLKSLPRSLLPGLVILFLMSFRRNTVSVGGTVVQLGRALMVLVM